MHTTPTTWTSNKASTSKLTFVANTATSQATAPKRQKKTIHISCVARYDTQAEIFLDSLNGFNNKRSTRTRDGGGVHSGQSIKVKEMGQFRLLSFHPTLKIENALPRELSIKIQSFTRSKRSNKTDSSRNDNNNTNNNHEKDEKKKKDNNEYISEYETDEDEVQEEQTKDTSRRHRRHAFENPAVTLRPGATNRWYGAPLSRTSIVKVSLRLQSFEWSTKVKIGALTNGSNGFIRKEDNHNHKRTHVHPNNNTTSTSKTIKVILQETQSSSLTTTTTTTTASSDSNTTSARTLTLNMEIHYDTVSSTVRIVIFTPYWVHNASGLPLMFRHHPTYGTVSTEPDIADQYGDVVRTKEEITSGSKNKNYFSGMYSQTTENKKGENRNVVRDSTTLLGAGPRKMGLKELLHGSQGEGRHGLREARFVSTLLKRKELLRKRTSNNNNVVLPLLSSNNTLYSSTSKGIQERRITTLMAGSNVISNRLSKNTKRAAASTAASTRSLPSMQSTVSNNQALDLDSFFTSGTSIGKQTSGKEEEESNYRLEDVLLVGHTDEINLTGRLSTRLARGMGTDHATATFHTLLPTDWSPPFGLDSAGTTGEVEITENGTTTTTTTTEGGSYASSSSSHHARAARAAYALGVSIGVAEPPFHRTKVISIMPRFVVVNLVGRSILVKQGVVQTKKGETKTKDSFFSSSSSASASSSKESDRYVGGPGGRSDALLVKASQRVPFHWSDSTTMEQHRTMSMRFDEYGWEESCTCLKIEKIKNSILCHLYYRL